MSLFENSEFQWRETFFVMFEKGKRPTAAQIQSVIDGLDGRLTAENMRTTENGEFEAVTLYAPNDFAAMDIVCTVGEEVTEQLPSLIEELEPNMFDDDEKAQLEVIKSSGGRLEVFHFEQHTFTAPEDGVDSKCYGSRWCTYCAPTTECHLRRCDRGSTNIERDVTLRQQSFNRIQASAHPSTDHIEDHAG